MSATITEPSTTLVSRTEPEFLEHPTKRKCYRRNCTETIIYRTDGLGKLGGKTVLMGFCYCPTHGELPATKHQRKLSSLVTNIHSLEPYQKIGDR